MTSYLNMYEAVTDRGVLGGGGGTKFYILLFIFVTLKNPIKRMSSSCCRWRERGGHRIPNLPNVPLENVGGLLKHISAPFSLIF